MPKTAPDSTGLATFPKKDSLTIPRLWPKTGVGKQGAFSPPPPGGLILPAMTRAQPVAYWSRVPSLSQLLLAALLRLAAMLVSNAVRPMRMLLSLLPRECHTDVEPDRLPAMDNGNRNKETEPAAAHSHLNCKTATSLRGSFSGKRRSRASREPRLERHGAWRFKPQSLVRNNRDSRDALRLPGNDGGCGWAPIERPRP